LRSISAVVLGGVVLAVNLWLNAPLFMPGDMPFPGSIERGYAGMARFVSEHPNPWGWNPFPYGGLPTQFMYSPVLPYLSAAWMRLLPHLPPNIVYRTIVGFAACLGPVSLFYFAFYFTRSRTWSMLGALGYSVFSPSYALFPAVERDRGIAQLPWRIQVLAKYGEGPHNTALMLIPVALLAVWLAAKAKGRIYPRVLYAAIVFAVAALTNWVGAFALAICCALLLLAAWGEMEFRRRRALAVAGLAYLLACFWLTPSVIKTIASNWSVDSFGYRLGATQWFLLAGVTTGALVIRVLFRLFHGSFYYSFVVLGAFVFGSIATAWYMFGADTIPESRRYALEFELFIALAVTETMRLGMRHTNATSRLCVMGCALVISVVAAPQVLAYITQGRQKWAPVGPETSIEYKLGCWMAKHPPQGRAFVSGGLRFKLNSWFDVPQVGGAFETGLVNRVPIDLAYRIRIANKLTPGREAEETLVYLKAVGAEYVVVHGPKSAEYYRDFVRPERLRELAVAYRSEHDTIYALPSRSLAHLVSPAEVAWPDRSLRAASIGPYIAAIDDPFRPRLEMTWTDSSTVVVTGSVAPDKLVALQINASPGWRAFQDGREISWTTDGLGFLVLHPSAATATRIEVQYRGTAEQRAFGFLSATAWCVSLIALRIRFWRSKPLRGAAVLA
jgi:hypothetical protein